METKYIDKGVNFPCTNEAIPAVVDGLELKSDDIVVSILGSGDIPLAIAPHVKKVYALDRNHSQVKYAKKQINCLKEGNLGEFYNINFIKTVSDPRTAQSMIQRKDYFSGEAIEE